MNVFITYNCWCIFKKLENPQTEEYCYLKELVLSQDFTWRYNLTTDPDDNPSESRFSANPGYQHCVVASADAAAHPFSGQG